jgi:outer membrane biosynthesis protein TonB
MIESFSFRQLTRLFLVLALAGAGFTACGKKSEPAAPATPGAKQPSHSPEAFAPPISGPVTPAVVTEGADSITHYLHYPKDAEAAKLEGAVQFFCDVTQDGVVESIHALVAKDETFKRAVQSALDWGHFTPATVNGQPVRVYLGGTVLFFFQDGHPIIVVSLATHDRDRVSKLANYVQPQLIGGLRHTLETAINSLTQGILLSGKAEVIVSVDQRGAVTGTSNITETPKGSGLGLLLDKALRKAQFTPAYENGSPAAGGINVVADFTVY